MDKVEKDEEREERIAFEAVVDAYDEGERWAGITISKKKSPFLLRKVLTSKKLTGKQAKQIIAKEFPQFVKSYGVLLIKFNEGWRSSRTLKPSEKCKYHYIWEKAVITEEDSE